MFIIGQAATPDAGLSGPMILWLAFYGILAISLAVVSGVFKPRSILGPPRVLAGESLAILMLIMVLGFMLWAFIPGVILGPPASSATTNPAAATQSTTAPAAPLYPPGKLMLATVISSFAGFLAMVIGNLGLRGDIRKIGLNPTAIRTGGWRGALGAFMMIWLVFVIAILSQILWAAVKYSHPQEHDLLRMLGKSQSSSMTFLLITSAALVAPVFEETLFRGHLQTLLSYGLARLILKRKYSAPLAPETILPQADLPIISYADPTTPLLPIIPSVFARWIAIILTSALFAAIHPAWTIPPIFVLSLCVGYAYERTGNLWVPITMHALFNATSTVLYLTSHSA